MILSICDNTTVLKVIHVVNIMITVIKIGVPIALIIAMMIDFMKAIKVGSDDLLAKAKGKVKNRVIAAVLIFLVPTFVTFIVNVAAPEDAEIKKCIDASSSMSDIDSMESSNVEALVSKAESDLTYSSYSSAYSAVSRMSDPEKKKSFLDRLANVQKQIDENNKKKKEEEKAE